MLAPVPNQIQNVLDKALKNQHISHALIFSGIDGSGRKLASYNLAKDLLCLDASNYKACGQCQSCKAILQLHIKEPDNITHPDFHVLQPDGQYIKVEQIREIINQAWVSPMLSHTKIFIINDAHLINQSGANALLKSLEEPPKQTFFILITNNQRNLIQTIRSRCQIFFFPIPQSNYTKNNRNHIIACELLDQSNFDGLQQIMIKQAQLSKKSINAMERRKLLKCLIDSLMQHIMQKLKNAPNTEYDKLIKYQDIFIESQKDLLANVKLDLLIVNLTINLSRI